MSSSSSSSSSSSNNEEIRRVMMAGNYFERLGLERKETERSIVRRAYRKLALKVHPDKNEGGPDATKAFQLLSDAFELLYDETDQKVYLETLNKNKSDQRSRKRRKKSKCWYKKDGTAPSWKDVETELRRREKMEAEYKKGKSEAYEDVRTRRVLRRSRKICRNLDEQSGIFQNRLWRCLVREEMEREKPRDTTERLGDIIRRDHVIKKASRNIDVQGILKEILVYLHDKHGYHDMDEEMKEVGIMREDDEEKEESNTTTSSPTEDKKMEKEENFDVALPWRCKTCHSGNIPGSKACSVCKNIKK